MGAHVLACGCRYGETTVTLCPTHAAVVGAASSAGDCRPDCYLCNPTAPIPWWAYRDRRQRVESAVAAARRYVETADESDPIRFAGALRNALALLIDAETTIGR